MSAKQKNASDKSDQQDSLEKDINRFLNGELSFAEYSRQWNESNYYEEDDEDIDSDGEDPSSRLSNKYGESSKKAKNIEDEKMAKSNRRLRRQLPPALLGLMGEANLRYARGDKDMAEKMCFEIIRQVPTASEPFQTLAEIYEGDSEKYLQFSLIAAHLNPVDSDQWLRLASISRERGDLKQEVICYTRAINATPKHLPYHLERIKVMKELDQKGLLSSAFNLTLQQCYVRLLRILPPSDGAYILNVAKEVAHHYHKDNKMLKALEAMNLAYGKCANLFTLEDVNLYLELLLQQKMYDKVLEVLVSKGNVDIEAEIQTVLNDDGIREDITNVVSCSIPTALPIDLRSKLAICLIHMKAFHLMDNIITSILEKGDPESTGDIYLDIEEALTEEGRHEDSLRLLKPLVHGQRFSLPAVWLKYAQCLVAIGKEDEAIEPFRKVIELAPQHFEARLKLASILKDKSIPDALIALEQNENTDVLSTTLLLERCKLHKLLGDKSGYLKVGELFLSRHFTKIRTREELPTFRSKDCLELLKAMREERGEQMEEAEEITFEDSTGAIPLATDWELLQDLVKVSCELGQYSITEKLTFSAMGSKRFLPYRSQIELSCLLACLYNKDNYYALHLVKDFVSKTPENHKLWNLYNLVVQKGDYVRHNKFLARLVARSNLDKMINILVGNNCLVAGTYKFALKEYFSIFDELKSPLAAFLSAITLAHIVSQKYASNKHFLVIQCIAFLTNYEKYRGKDAQQEIYYNFGRMYHQLGILHKAREYYEKALKITNKLIDDNPEVVDLRREIAYNLHVIHRIDAPDMAQMYLEKYIVI